MARHDDTVYLRYILDAIARIQQYIHSIDEDSFLQNPLIQDGVIRQEQIIGKASRRLSLDLRNRYLAIPWQDVVGMRSKLVHDYFGVDLALRPRLPRFCPALSRLHFAGLPVRARLRLRKAPPVLDLDGTNNSDVALVC